MGNANSGHDGGSVVVCFDRPLGYHAPQGFQLFAVTRVLRATATSIAGRDADRVPAVVPAEDESRAVPVERSSRHESVDVEPEFFIGLKFPEQIYMPAERFRDDLEARNIFGISWYLAKSEEEMDRGICVQAAEDTFLPLDTVATLLHGRDAHVWLSLRMHAAYFSPELHGVKRRGQRSSRSTAAAEDKLLLDDDHEDDQKKSGNVDDEDEVEVAIRRRIEKRLRRVRQKEAEEGAKEAAAEALFQQEHQGLSATAAPQAGEDGSVLDEVVAHYFPGTAGGSHNYSGNNTPGRRGSLSARGGGGGGVWLAETSRISAKSAMFLQASLGETPEGDSVLIRPTSAQNLKSLSPSPVVVASPRNVLLSARGEPARSARDLSEIVRQQYGDASSKKMSTKTATSRASRNGGSQQGSPAKVELHQGGRAGSTTTTAPRFAEAEPVEDEVVEFAASALPSSSINANNADGTEVITPPRSVRFFGRAKGLVGETPPGAPPPLFYNDPVVPKVQVPSLALSGLAEPASDEGRNLHNNASPSRAAGPPGGGFNSARVLLLSHRSTTLSTARSSPGAFAKRQLRLETEDATLTEKEIEVVHNCFERSLAEASADIEFEQPKVRITFVHLEPLAELLSAQGLSLPMLTPRSLDDFRRQEYQRRLYAPQMKLFQLQNNLISALLKDLENKEPVPSSSTGHELPAYNAQLSAQHLEILKQKAFRFVVGTFSKRDREQGLVLVKAVFFAWLEHARRDAAGKQRRQLLDKAARNGLRLAFGELLRGCFVAWKGEVREVRYAKLTKEALRKQMAEQDAVWRRERESSEAQGAAAFSERVQAEVQRRVADERESLRAEIEYEKNEALTLRLAEMQHEAHQREEKLREQREAEKAAIVDKMRGEQIRIAESLLGLAGRTASSAKNDNEDMGTASKVALLTTSFTSWARWTASAVRKRSKHELGAEVERLKALQSATTQKALATFGSKAGNLVVMQSAFHAWRRMVLETRIARKADSALVSERQRFESFRAELAQRKKEQLLRSVAKSLQQDEKSARRLVVSSWRAHVQAARSLRQISEEHRTTLLVSLAQRVAASTEKGLKSQCFAEWRNLWTVSKARRELEHSVAEMQDLGQQTVAEAVRTRMEEFSLYWASQHSSSADRALLHAVLLKWHKHAGAGVSERRREAELATKAELFAAEAAVAAEKGQRKLLEMQQALALKEELFAAQLADAAERSRLREAELERRREAELEQQRETLEQSLAQEREAAEAKRRAELREQEEAFAVLRKQLEAEARTEKMQMAEEHHKRLQAVRNDHALEHAENDRKFLLQFEKIQTEFQRKKESEVDALSARHAEQLAKQAAAFQDARESLDARVKEWKRSTEETIRQERDDVGRERRALEAGWQELKQHKKELAVREAERQEELLVAQQNLPQQLKAVLLILYRELIATKHGLTVPETWTRIMASTPAKRMTKNLFELGSQRLLHPENPNRKLVLQQVWRAFDTDADGVSEEEFVTGLPGRKAFLKEQREKRRQPRELLLSVNGHANHASKSSTSSTSKESQGARSSAFQPSPRGGAAAAEARATKALATTKKLQYHGELFDVAPTSSNPRTPRAGATATSAKAGTASSNAGGNNYRFPYLREEENEE